MREEELLGIVISNIEESTGDFYTDINDQRTKALDAYFQQPYGNEVEGKSHIVTSEVADTVEWFMPSLLKVFTAGGNIAEFTPSSPDDIEAAAQETDVINYFFFNKMNGFYVLHDWFKDALLQKNGIVKYFYDERITVTEEEYKGLTEEEFTVLAGDPELEPVEWEVNTETGTYDVVFKRTVNESVPVAEVVPPEEFYIHPNYEQLSLEDTVFCAHETTVSASDLISMGYSKAVVDELNEASYDAQQEEEKNARSRDIGGYYSKDSSGDDAARNILYAECYIRVDYDGDGITELRKICIANRTEILENEQTDVVPFVSITPVPLPHRFHGRSIADQTMDLQLQKTTLLRNILDNLYLINNQRTIVLDGGANIDDLLVSRAGGIVREYVPDAVRPFPTTPFTGHPYEMLEYFDGMKEARTGITKYNQGLDANSLNKTASGMNMIMDASQSRIELVARLFAEGVRRLMLGIHKLLQQNTDKELVVRIRGKFVPVDPRQWRDRTDMTINVGLGTSNDNDMLQRLNTLFGYQQQLLSLGFVLPDHIHNTLSKIVESMGLQNVDLYFNSPEQVQPPPPQPDPQMLMVQGQMETATQSNAIEDKKVEYNHLEKMAQLENDKLKIFNDTKNKQEVLAKDLTALELEHETDVPGAKV